MKLTIEQIDELRKRANVSYKEAKEALEKTDGDLVEALAYLEEQNKTYSTPFGHGFGYGHQHHHKHGFAQKTDVIDKIKKIVKKGNQTFLRISKGDMTILNLPLTLVVLLALFATPFVVTALIVAVVFGCKIKFKKANGNDHSMNKHFEMVSSFVNNATDKFTQEMKNE